MLTNSVSSVLTDYRASVVPLRERGNASSENIDLLIHDTIALVCARDGLDQQRYNEPQFIKRVKNYLNLAKDGQEVEAITRLLIQNAEPLLQQVNSRYHTNISFKDLLELRLKHPERSLAQLLVYLVADQDPQLAPFAQRLLPAVNNVIQDPHIQYVQAIQSQISLSRMDPAEIYEETNEADRQYLATIEEQNLRNKEELRRHNYIRLANLELEKNNSPENREDYTRAKIREAVGVRS